MCNTMELKPGNHGQVMFQAHPVREPPYLAKDGSANLPYCTLSAESIVEVISEIEKAEEFCYNI